MPSDDPSLLSLIAAGFYVAILLSALFAAGTAVLLRQPGDHWSTWAVIALVFAVLAAIRVTGLEDILRDNLRDLLRMENSYGQRRDIQRPMAAAAFAAISVGAGFVLLRKARGIKGRRNIALLAATAGTMVMALLMALRIISLHQVDALLYGPLKLNWVADIGASCMVLGAALYYVLRVRKRP